MDELRTRVEPGTGAADRRVVVEVVDDGSGIDPALRDRIFEPYFTTKTADAEKGTGLGLSLVHATVLAHGGTIEVGDNRPRGTVMRVTLPTQGAAPTTLLAGDATPCAVGGAG